MGVTYLECKQVRRARLLLPYTAPDPATPAAHVTLLQQLQMGGGDTWNSNVKDWCRTTRDFKSSTTYTH